MKLPPDACRGHNESCNRLAELGNRLGPIEYRSVGQVQNYGGNPRRHPEKQLVRLTASVSRFGVALPLETRHNGWPDIEVGGPGPGPFPVYRFDGAAYMPAS